MADIKMKLIAEFNINPEDELSKYFQRSCKQCSNSIRYVEYYSGRFLEISILCYSVLFWYILVSLLCAALCRS